MANVTIINKFGTMQGWNSVTVNILGRDLEGIIEINYDDNQNKQNEYGSGKYAIGRSEGNYEANASITLYKEEVDAIQSAIPVGTRMQDIAVFDMVVIYTKNDGTLTKDIVHNCEFTSKSKSIKQGDGTIAIQFPLLVSHLTEGLTV